MSSTGYTAWAVTAGEQPTTAYWNILGGNDASFNTGAGFNDGIIINRHLGANMLSAGSNAYTNASNAGGTGVWFNVGGLKILLITGCTTNASAWNFINWSVVGFTSAPYCFGNSLETTVLSGWVEFAGPVTGGSGTPTTTGCSILTRSSTTTNTSTTITVLAIGT